MATEPDPTYHLFLDPHEVPVAASALRLLISDEHASNRSDHGGHDTPYDDLHGTRTVPEQHR